MSSQDFKVIIAGGSVAGLALANMLERVGIDFLILERHQEIAPEIGASIGIFPHGCRILDQLGCYDEVLALNKGGSFQDLDFRSFKGDFYSRLSMGSEHFVKR